MVSLASIPVWLRQWYISNLFYQLYNKKERCDMNAEDTTLHKRPMIQKLTIVHHTASWKPVKIIKHSCIYTFVRLADFYFLNRIFISNY